MEDRFDLRVLAADPSDVAEGGARALSGHDLPGDGGEGGLEHGSNLGVGASGEAGRDVRVGSAQRRVLESGHQLPQPDQGVASSRPPVFGTKPGARRRRQDAVGVQPALDVVGEQQSIPPHRPTNHGVSAPGRGQVVLAHHAVPVAEGEIDLDGGGAKTRRELALSHPEVDRARGIVLEDGALEPIDAAERAMERVSAVGGVGSIQVEPEPHQGTGQIISVHAARIGALGPPGRHLLDHVRGPAHPPFARSEPAHPQGLAVLSAAVLLDTSSPRGQVPVMTLGVALSVPDRTLLMGVVNVTPDSFSDGGLHAAVDDARRHAAALVEAGADFVDVGGESTRPGADPVPEAEELRRVLPVLEALERDGVGPVSIDTYKAVVARAAVERGAVLVNDISGGTFDPELVPTVAACGVGLVLSHARTRPPEMQRGIWSYQGGVVAAVRRFLEGRVEAAERAGVSRERLLLDPGIGFGKTVRENLELLRNLDRIRVAGLPVLVGTSRKGFIGRLTGRAVDDREFGTAATVALAVASGADMVRIHDVSAMRDVVRVADAWSGKRDFDEST